MIMILGLKIIELDNSNLHLNIISNNISKYMAMFCEVILRRWPNRYLLLTPGNHSLLVISSVIRLGNGNL